MTNCPFRISFQLLIDFAIEENCLFLNIQEICINWLIRTDLALHAFYSRKFVLLFVKETLMLSRDGSSALLSFSHCHFFNNSCHFMNLFVSFLLIVQFGFSLTSFYVIHEFLQGHFL